MIPNWSIFLSYCSEMIFQFGLIVKTAISVELGTNAGIYWKQLIAEFLTISFYCMMHRCVASQIQKENKSLSLGIK